MGLGGSGGDGGASAAAQADQARRNRIRQGIANIDKVFNGSNVGTNPYTGAPVVGHSYYLSDGTPVTMQQLQQLNPAYTPPPTNTGPGGRVNAPGWGGNVGGGGSNSVPQYLTRTGYTGANGPVYYGDPGFGSLYSSTTHNGGFDDNFYKGISSAYSNYATPQLDTQYHDAADQLAYALARQGISSSTAAGKQQSTLEREYNQYRTDISSQGNSYADKARTDIANARNDLVNQVTATEDPAAATSGALAESAIASQPPVFSPVGNFTFNVGSGLVNGLNNNAFSAPASSIYSSSPYSGGVNGSGGNSVRYIN